MLIGSRSCAVYMKSPFASSCRTWSAGRETRRRQLVLPLRERRVTPLPVLSGTNAFAKCSARNNGPSLEYDIACAGRDAPRAKAIYTLTAGHFRGRIAMVMGAKNMTMTEVQTVRRVGAATRRAALAALRDDPLEPQLSGTQLCRPLRFRWCG
jgi:hypothetical protein